MIEFIKEGMVTLSGCALFVKTEELNALSEVEGDFFLDEWNLSRWHESGHKWELWCHNCRPTVSTGGVEVFHSSEACNAC